MPILRVCVSFSISVKALLINSLTQRYFQCSDEVQKKQRLHSFGQSFICFIDAYVREYFIHSGNEVPSSSGHCTCSTF